MCSRTILFLIVAVLQLCVSVAWSRPNFTGQVPNGRTIGCVLCHEDPQGGGSRNSFGRQVESLFFNGGRVQWGVALASLDADGDGYSNGVELLDPNGVWRPGTADPGSTADLSLPHEKNSTPAKQTSVIHATWSAVKYAFHHVLAAPQP